MAKRKPKKKTTLGYCEMLDLDLHEFMCDLMRDRSLFAVLTSLEWACEHRADRFREELKQQQHPSVEALCEQEIEFFGDAADAVSIAHNSLREDWKNREMPTVANGEIRLVSQRASDAGHAYLEQLLTTLNDPGTGDEDWSKAAAMLAHDGQGMIWYSTETGAPNFELAKAFGKACGELIDPRVSAEKKRQVAAELREFIVENGERRSSHA